MGHRLPSLLHNSENVIVAHGYGQESTEGEVPTQNSMDKQDELETTVLSTFLGMPTPWMSTGAWKSPSPADLCVSVCAFWMWIPLPVFQTRVQARVCQQLPGCVRHGEESSLLSLLIFLVIIILIMICFECNHVHVPSSNKCQFSWWFAQIETPVITSLALLGALGEKRAARSPHHGARCHSEPSKG